MNRDDPAEGFALIELIGADEYNRLVREHDRASIVATMNGHEIWPVQTRFGRLYRRNGAGFLHARGSGSVREGNNGRPSDGP